MAIIKLEEHFANQNQQSSHVTKTLQTSVSCAAALGLPKKKTYKEE
jgi:hypothetical protein